MLNFIQKTALASLACLLPVMGYAQCTTGQFTDNNDGTVTDNETGLMWKKCTEGQSGQDPLTCMYGSLNQFNWQEALQRAENVNAGTAGTNLNYTDWRVPNIKELASIAEEQCDSPAINDSVFPDTPSSGFWSASPYAANADSSWYVYFLDGSGSGNYKHSSYYVRLVRGGQ